MNADKDTTPEWPLMAPSDPLDLNEEGFDPALDPLDETADDAQQDTEDDGELDPDLRDDLKRP